MGATRPVGTQVFRGLAFTVALLLLVPLILFAVDKIHPSAPPRDQQPQGLVCPHGTPDDCAHLVSLALRVPQASIPTFRMPSEVEYNSGFFTEIEGVASQWLGFKDRQSPKEMYDVTIDRADTRTPLRPTAGRVYSRSGGWFEERWVSGRAGRHYLANIINGHVRHYAFADGPFVYQVSVDSGSIATPREREIVTSLLDGVG